MNFRSHFSSYRKSQKKKSAFIQFKFHHQSRDNSPDAGRVDFIKKIRDFFNLQKKSSFSSFEKSKKKSFFNKSSKSSHTFKNLYRPIPPVQSSYTLNKNPDTFSHNSRQFNRSHTPNNSINFLVFCKSWIKKLSKSKQITEKVWTELKKVVPSDDSLKTIEVGDPAPPRTESPGQFKYYFGFFLILALLPILYFDNDGKSFFLNWVEAHGLPIKADQDPGKVAILGNESLNFNMPQVVLLKNDPKSNEDYPNFQVSFNRNSLWKGRLGSERLGGEGISDFHSVDKDGQAIYNYESTNELILEENIGDWIDENDQDIFDNEINPFVTVKEDLNKLAFDHQRYRVTSGDSLWSISKRFNISIDSIISLNQITTPRGLAIDSELMIPRLSGIYYKVKKNDSLFKIAQSYGVDLAKIRDYNQLGGYLQVGKVLFIPGGKFSRSQKDYIFGNLFTTPVNGVLTSKYGFRLHPIKRSRFFHTGIDIAKNVGDRVRAAADGLVVQSGPNGGYGKYVKVKHDLGYETAYAHLSAVWVKPGQKIKKGQYLGSVGNTGISTGPHLHFEVKHKGKFINPLRFVKY